MRVLGPRSHPEAQDFIILMVAGKIYAIKLLAFTIDPRIPVPPDHATRILSIDRSGPDDIDTIDELCRGRRPQSLDLSHRDRRRFFNCFEVAIDIAVVGFNKVQLLPGPSLRNYVATSTFRRVLGIAACIILHPGDITERSDMISSGSEDLLCQLIFSSVLVSCKPYPRLAMATSM